MKVVSTRPAPRLVRPVRDDEPEHRPVCAGCQQPWPCDGQRQHAYDVRVLNERQADCWACGKRAKPGSTAS